MTPATAAAVSLLERLRTLAETWTEFPGTPPGLYSLPLLPGESPYRFERPGFQPAVGALCRLDYYEKARNRDDATEMIDEAIEALKGETT